MNYLAINTLIAVGSIVIFPLALYMAWETLRVVKYEFSGSRGIPILENESLYLPVDATIAASSTQGFFYFHGRSDQHLISHPIRTGHGSPEYLHAFEEQVPAGHWKFEGHEVLLDVRLSKPASVQVFRPFGRKVISLAALVVSAVGLVYSFPMYSLLLGLIR